MLIQYFIILLLYEMYMAEFQFFFGVINCRCLYSRYFLTAFDAMYSYIIGPPALFVKIANIS